MLKIGDHLYRHVSFHGYWIYRITAEIKRENALLYEVECQACTHDFRCLLLVAKDKKENSYSFVSMVSGKDENYGDQEYWHTSFSEGEKYFVSLEDAKKAFYDESLDKKRAEIQACEAKYKLDIESLNRSLQELEAHYHNIFN